MKNPQKKHLNSKMLSSFIILFLTIFAFQFALGLEKANPLNISWLFEARNDLATNQIGWSFFRDSTWQFPLGTIKDYYYPIGANIGFTDSIPLLAIIFKLLSFLLPENFQYIGIWLFLCMFLNGYYSLKTFQHFKINSIISYLFVILILLSPIFIFRQRHAALCAQWLLIGSIYLYVSTDKESDPNKKLKHFIILLFLSCFITPYLTIVVFGFLALFLFKLFFYEAIINLKKAILYFFTSIVMIFSSWVTIGLIDFSKHTAMASTGFYGAYKMNLNSLYNSLGYSKFIPEQELITGNQQDAFMYLGLGFMLLALVSLLYLVIYSIKSKRLFFKKNLTPLLVFCIALSVFATTSTLSFNNKEIFTIPFLEWMNKVGDVFRASGRFFWSVYYLMIFYFIVLFNKIPIGKITKVIFVCVLVLIQLVDISPMFNRKETKKGDYKPELSIGFWNSIFSNFKNVITVMPFNNDLVNYQDYQEIAFFAYKNKVTVTNGNLARYDGKSAQEFTNNLINDIVKGNFPIENLYITSKENLKYFSPAFDKRLINVLSSEGYYFIFSKSKKIKNLSMSPKDIKELDIAKKENLKKIEFEICNNPLEKSLGEVKSNIDNEFLTDLICQLKGWAFIENRDNNIGDSIFVYLRNDKYLYKSKCILNPRKDITIVYKKENLDNSGFESFTFINKIKKGRYDLIIAIKDKNGGLYYSNTNKSLKIGYKEVNKPIKTDLILPLNTNINHGIDKFEFQNKVLTILGWAAYKEIESTDSMIEVLMIKDNSIYKAETIPNIRKDVTEASKNGINYDNSGFEVKVETKNLPKGNYKIGVRIINKKYNKDAYFITDKKISI